MDKNIKASNTATTHTIPSDSPPDCFFYDPGQRKYLVVDQDQIVKMVMSVKQLDDFQTKIALARAEKPSAKKTCRLEDIGIEIGKHLNGSTEKPVKKKGLTGLIPLLLAHGTVSLYDRPLVFARYHDLEEMKWLDADDPEVANRFKKINDRYEKRIEAALKKRDDKKGDKKDDKPKSKEEKKKELLKKYGKGETSAGWKLWELKDKDGKPYDGRCVENWILQPDEELGKDNRYVSAKPEVQFMRYVLSAEAGAKWDPKEGTIKLGAEGEAKFNFIDAKVTGELFLPDKDGIDLFYYIRMMQQKGKLEKALVKHDSKFYLRLKYCLTGFAYAGVSASASVAIPEIDYSDYIPKKDDDNSTSNASRKSDQKNEKKEVTTKVGAEGEAFVGGKAGVSLAQEFEWHNGDKTPAEFNTISSLKWTGSGQIGLGIGGALALKYENGGFTFEIYLQATFKLGLSGKYEVEVDVEQAYRIITHLLRSVEYHNLASLHAEGFKKLSDYGLAKAIQAKDMAIDAWDAAYDKAAREAEKAYEDVKKELQENRRRIEDTLKKFHTDAQHSTQGILKELNTKEEELCAKLEQARKDALKKKKEFCKALESIADEVGDFKSWLMGIDQKELKYFKNALVDNFPKAVSFFQNLLPETAGALFALLGDGVSGKEIDDKYQKLIVDLSKLWESKHEKVHILNNFAIGLIDKTFDNSSAAVTEGKKTLITWGRKYKQQIIDIYQDIQER